MIQCPLDGCDYEAETAGSVIAHATSKTDEVHSGVGGQQVRAMLDAKDTVTQNTDESTDVDTGETETSESTSGSDPAMDGPPAGDSGGSDDSGADIACPDCDGELIDYREHSSDPEGGFPTPDDYYCSECGQGWNE